MRCARSGAVGIHGSRFAHARARNRREHRHLLGGERRHPAAAALSTPRTVDVPHDALSGSSRTGSWRRRGEQRPPGCAWNWPRGPSLRLRQNSPRSDSGARKLSVKGGRPRWSGTPPSAPRPSPYPSGGTRSPSDKRAASLRKELGHRGRSGRSFEAARGTPGSTAGSPEAPGAGATRVVAPHLP